MNSEYYVMLSKNGWYESMVVSYSFTYNKYIENEWSLSLSLYHGNVWQQDWSMERGPSPSIDRG